MLSKEDNERITRTDAGTPMGDVFRRYWIPAALSSELPEPGGAPIRVRLLGEDLVAFRDTTGNVELTVTPSEVEGPPQSSPFGLSLDCARDDSGRARYPTWEGGGIVWTYMGPPAHQPPPPDYELVRAPASHRYVSKTLQRCNYLQGLEGGLDSSHATIMHRDNIGDRSWLSVYESLIPRIDVERTGYGFMYTGIRQYPTEQWVRAYQYVMPAMQMRGAISGNFNRPGIPPKIDGHIWIPLDDHNCYVYNWMYSYDASTPLPEAAAISEETHFGRGPDDLLPDFSLKQNMSNDYGIDRQRQKTYSFTGISGVNTQDVALQEGMGPIVDRTQEHLGTTDRAIIAMRQLLLEATRAVGRGEPLRGVDPSAYRHVRPVDHKIAPGLDWRTTLASELTAKF